MTSAPPAPRPSIAQPIATGLVATVTGFASTFAILLAGLAAVGADAAQASSGLLAVCLAIGIGTIVLSLRHRIPLMLAWSTPGAALLVATAGVTDRFGEAVAAFLVAAALIMLTGLWPALGRLVARIPRSIAGAMLAGIVFPLALAPVQAAVEMPLLALPIIVLWLVLFRWAPRWATPAALILAVVLVAVTAGDGWLEGARLAPQVVAVVPEFDPMVVLSIALPLYIVTMAGQNLPGMAVVSSFGYPVPSRSALLTSGAGSALGAFGGGITVNLAAITAALAAGPEGAPEPERRWIASLSAGAGYLLLAPLAGVAAAFVAASPPLLIQSVAGLALLSALVGAVVSAVEVPRQRTAAIATFLVTASGIAVVGIGSAFWGLLVGGVVLLATTRRERS